MPRSPKPQASTSFSLPHRRRSTPRGFATNIHVAGLTDVLDGASRGAHHFDGVATVVTKLFGIVRPDTAYFGQKDAQQVLVVRRVVRDLDLDVRIVACPIVREADGLAMSSRNVYLDPAARVQATALNRALDAGAAVSRRVTPPPGASSPPRATCSATPGSTPNTSSSATPRRCAPSHGSTATPCSPSPRTSGPPGRLIDNHVLRAAEAPNDRETEAGA